MEYILVFGVAKLYRMEGCVRKSHKRMGWQATGRRVSKDEDIVNLASNFVSIGEQDTLIGGVLVRGNIYMFWGQAMQNNIMSTWAE